MVYSNSSNYSEEPTVYEETPPYTACTFWFVIPEEMTRETAQADDGSCRAILGSDCVRDMKDQLQRLAKQAAGKSRVL